MNIQEALFEMPVVDTGSTIPPTGIKPAILAEPLGTCIKCGQDGQLKSPSGTVYCKKHGYCQRRTCLKSVEKFVWHERLKIWCCPCILKFENDIQKHQEEVRRKEEAMIQTGVWR